MLHKVDVNTACSQVEAHHQFLFLWWWNLGEVPPMQSQLSKSIHALASDLVHILIHCIDHANIHALFRTASRSTIPSTKHLKCSR